MSDFYEVDLPDMRYSRQHSFNVNNKHFMILFTFSDEMYQILRDFETTNMMRAKSDPLVTVSGIKEYIKDYTYIEYYLSIPDDIDTWLASQTYLPVSIANMETDAEKKAELELRIALSHELQNIRTQYKVMCRWQFTLSSDGEILCDGFVEKGSWSMPYNDVSIRFEYDTDYIGFEDIQNVTMIVRVD